MFVFFSFRDDGLCNQILQALYYHLCIYAIQQVEMVEKNFLKYQIIVLMM